VKSICPVVVINICIITGRGPDALQGTQMVRPTWLMNCESAKTQRDADATLN
jgi:hypothetical protein